MTARRVGASIVKPGACSYVTRGESRVVPGAAQRQRIDPARHAAGRETMALRRRRDLQSEQRPEYAAPGVASTAAETAPDRRRSVARESGQQRLGELVKRSSPNGADKRCDDSSSECGARHQTRRHPKLACQGE